MFHAGNRVGANVIDARQMGKEGAIPALSSVGREGLPAHGEDHGRHISNISAGE